jgi:hypothetical protein
MSISIVSSLPALLPVNNPDVVIVSSNLTASANFRYICDVSGATATARLKCDKLPTTNYGFFGVNKVVETLIAPKVPQLTSGWQDGGYAVKANLTFREEYGSPPAVATATVTASLIAWQAGFRQQDYAAAIAEPTTYYSTSISGDTVAVKTVTNRPQSNAIGGLLETGVTVSSGTNDFLSMPVDSAVTGVLISVQYYNGNPGVTATRTFTVTGSVTGLTPMINCGPLGLYNLTSGQCSDSNAGSVNFPTQGGSIRVRMFTNAVNATNPLALPSLSRSPQYLYRIDNCERYDQLRVFFRNMYGGVDGYTFTKKNRKSVNVNRQTYGYNSSVYGDDRYDKQWNITYRDTYTLQSDWLTDLEFAWLQEMVYSPECWMELSGALVPIIVQTNTYTVRTRNNDQLQTITVDVQIAYENTSL